MNSETDSEVDNYLLKLIKHLFKKNSTAIKDNELNLKNLNTKTLGESKVEMIRGIVQLSDLNAREIMIPRVDTMAVPLDTSLKDLVTIAADAGHSRIPVFEETIDNINGILYVKDLLTFLKDKRKKFDLKKLLHKPLNIPETMPLDELLLEFKKRRQHLAIVIDEYGGVAGIVTMEDVLEEIVGDINDEFDENELPEIIQLNKNSFDIDSRMTIDDLNAELELNLPSDEYDTLGGFVLDIFGEIPSQDDSVKYSTISIKIKDIDGTRINRVILSKTKKSHVNSKD